ncbi:hypothetical protein L1049_022074 [Liquidambar formosana]|uniref:Uncharacterized protein n=1 Tax=Liquidambar formosana TaxID=63359 RepID=A0AAP0WNF3_LIQFO
MSELFECDAFEFPEFCCDWRRGSFDFVFDLKRFVAEKGIFFLSKLRYSIKCGINESQTCEMCYMRKTINVV